MGQEIEHCDFTQADFDHFEHHLAAETRLLAELLKSGRFSERLPVAGFEIEAWLMDDKMAPAPVNPSFLEALNNPLACAELAKFNIELNNHPVALQGAALTSLHNEQEALWRKARHCAESLGVHLLMIGIPPTLKQSVLNLNNMSELNRYRALNEQIFCQRGKPIHLEIVGHQHLKCDHNDVMLESAATSFQVHMQVPASSAHYYYNASILASAPLVAISANSPYLFGKDLWAETRIPLFEQSIEVGGFGGVAHGPLRRVSFGSSYVRDSIMECYDENQQHLPVLLPMQLNGNPEQLEYIRLHNGTIWRWNRPLIGFDPDGRPHIRIEQRVIPSGPTLIDMVANAALFYGLTEYLSREAVIPEPVLPFAQAKDNFYQAARLGLKAGIQWLDGSRQRLQPLLLDTIIPQAETGLDWLGIDRNDAKRYLAIIRQRAESGQTGSAWQRAFVAAQPDDDPTVAERLTRRYLKQQGTGKPVHQWTL